MEKEINRGLIRTGETDIIMNQNYNIFEINEALFAFDQSLLGV